MSGPQRAHHTDDGDESPAVFSDINITPLTDIFLVLLIIFMVTSTALVEEGQGASGAGVRVDLPKGAARELSAAAKDFPVGITQQGQLYAEGKLIDAESLKARFVQLAKESPEAVVIVNADQGAAHGRVVEVMELAKAAGLDKLAIATEGEEKK